MGCCCVLAKVARCGQLPSVVLVTFCPAHLAAGLCDMEASPLDKPGSGRVSQAGVPCGRGELAAYLVGGGKASS